MPRGRRFMPASDQDGVWFQHIGLPKNIENRVTGTTTGLQMNARFDPKANELTTIRCPPKYVERQQRTYNSTNPFSIHDNRNSFQDHGIYFGKGLGKKKLSSMTSQHKSADIITWDGKLNPETLLDINSLYREDFLGDMNTTQPTQRRYPDHYPIPMSGCIGPSTSTTVWVKERDEVPRTFLQTLANSQEPHLPPDPWKYSYHAHSFAKNAKNQRTKRRKAMAACS